MKTLIVMGFGILTLSNIAFADKAGECTRLWALEKEMGCPSVEATPLPANTKENFLVNSEFGPSKCVIEENLDHEKKTLKKECEDWLKERKTDLGANFLTGTCNSDCSPCPKNEVLRHCTYKGEVHYMVR